MTEDEEAELLSFTGKTIDGNLYVDFEDFDRNPMYELNNPLAYNVDDNYGSSLTDPDLSNYDTPENARFALRYRNWKKDYFNCVSPYFQGADWLTDTFDAPVFDGYTSSQTNPMNPFSSLTGKDAQSYLQASSTVPKTLFSISNLRSAFALDKLYRLSIAAGDGDYGSQIRAHYGFDVPYDNCKSRFPAIS